MLMKILVVDDDRKSRIIDDLLKERNYEIVKVSWRKQAFEN